MSTHEKATFEATYQWAGSWEKLPWAHQEPTLFLAEICRRRQPGRALDIGCGAGTDSVFLAQQGWDVTALDFMPRALEFTRERADAAGVCVNTVEADIIEWQPPQRFDLVLDHGLLHNMDPQRHLAYRRVLLDALASDGEFVLLHWHPLYPGQADGRMGPHRASRADIKAFFAPELQERYFAREEFEDLTSVVGGGMTQAYYWFRPNAAWQQPAELLRQIESTLAANGFATDGAWQAEHEHPDLRAETELLCKLTGPGRLGIEAVQPEPSELNAVIDAFSQHAGVARARVLNLFRFFVSGQHAGICVADARCDRCQVRFCKRLRYR